MSVGHLFLGDLGKTQLEWLCCMCHSSPSGTCRLDSGKGGKPLNPNSKNLLTSFISVSWPKQVTWPNAKFRGVEIYSSLFGECPKSHVTKAPNTGRVERNNISSALKKTTHHLSPFSRLPSLDHLLASKSSSFPNFLFTPATFSPLAPSCHCPDLLS